jgi:dienelactone hydrolase
MAFWGEGEDMRKLSVVIVALVTAGVLAGCWPSVGTNFADPGPYGDVSVQTDTEHTYYYPTNLRTDGVRHPVILWGNGTFLNPTHYDALLRHLASHGFIVAAANTSNAGSGTEMLAGLDHLTTFNSEVGNVFFDKVDLTRVAAMGHSQGGGGAINAARDARVDTVVAIQPGGGTLSQIHSGATVWFLSGSADTTVSSSSVRSKYDAVVGRLPAAYGDLLGADHFQPIVNGNGYRGPITAWLRWQLMDDPIAENQFVGNCAYCTDPIWKTYVTNPLLQALAPPPPP